MTILFFMQRVITIITAEPFDGSRLQEAAKLCDLVVCSVELMQSFVGDLLDLRQLKFNRLVLDNKPFNFVDVIRNVGQIFAPQLSM